MSSKKKPSQEARERLKEKVADVQAKSLRLHTLIKKISEQPIANAEEVLKEKNKSKFLSKYVKASTELEGCLNHLLLVTDAIASLESSDGESESSGDDDDESDNQSVITNATSVTLERFDSQSTRCGSHESLASVFSTTELHDAISDISHQNVSEDRKGKGTCQNNVSPISTVNGLSNGSTPVNSLVNIPNEVNKSDGIYKPPLNISPILSVNDASNPSMPVKSVGNVAIENIKNDTSVAVTDANAKEENYISSAENEITTDYETAEENSFQMLTDAIVEEFNWEFDVPYPVVVTNTHTPLDFYIQLVNPDYSYLVNQLDVHFLKEAKNGYNKGGISYVPPIETFCCAKSSKDGFWYRAKIIEIIDQPKDNIKSVIIEKVTVKVFFIDEGYEEVILLEHIKPLGDQFAKLPAQSCKCILGGIQPVKAKEVNKVLSFIECNQMWSPESISFFEKFFKNKDICSSYFYYPPPAAYNTTHNISKDTLVCDLYIIHPTVSKVHWWKTKTDKNRLPIEDHIGFKMICNNMAAPCPYFKSELTLENSLEVLTENLRQQISINEEVDNCQRNTVIKQENDSYDLKKKITDNRQENVAVRQENKENISLPSSHAMVESPEENHEVGARLEEVARILDENMNLNNISKNKHSPVCEREEVKERRNQIVQKDPRWPADEKHAASSKSLDNKSSDSSKQPAAKNIFLHRELKEQQSPFVNNNQWPNDEKPIPSKKDFFPSKNVPTQSFTQNCVKKEDQSKVENSVLPVKPPSHTEFNSSMFGSTFKETILPVEEGIEEAFHKILVSEVVNPGLFYVHLVTEAVVLLDKLMQELNIYYSQKKDKIRSYTERESIKYEPGNAVAVFCSSDNQWFRACVLSVRTVTGGKQEYELLYVDFGGTKWMSDDCILPILTRFCDLPMVIIACCLADLKPLSNVVTKQIKGVSVHSAGFESPDSDNSQTDLVWPEQTTVRLKGLILTRSPLMISLKNVAKNSDGLYEVLLYDTSDNKDVFINQLLVDEGLASSEVLSKVVPSVKITEAELEKQIIENNALESWDPMKEQYLSKRNTYDVDTDDAGVAALGYVQPKNTICTNFHHRGYCYRGDNCKFVHANIGDPILDSVEVFCDDTILDLPKPDKCVPVVIRGLLDPTHFWVNFPYGIDWEKNEDNTSESCGELALDKLHHCMNQHYSKNYSKKTNLSVFAEGELIAAKFHEDDKWYRARVINTAEELVQVFYVDYGNTDVITEDNTRKLEADFLQLPFQAVECFLFNTYLEDEVIPGQEEFQQMRIKFRDLVADKVLMAYVVSSSITKSLVVMLYDTTKEPHLYINDLVRSWDGVVKKDVSDTDSLKNRLMGDVEQKPGHKVSYIPG